MADQTLAPFDSQVRITQILQLLAGENQTVNRLFGGGAASNYTVTTASTLVKTGACFLVGYNVTTVTATAKIDIRDAVAAGAGNIVASLPIAKAVGEYALPQAIPMGTGIYIDYNTTGTGTVVLLWLA